MTASAASEVVVEPLTPAVGAVVRGVDLGNPLTDADAQQLAAALWKHLVLFFPEQDIDDDQQVAFTARFGVVELIHGRAVSHLLDDAEHPPGVDEWHTDVSNKPDPPAVGILRAHTVPPAGGDTCWASLYRAYEVLSPAMRAFVGPLHVRHGSSPAYLAMVERMLGSEAAERARTECWAVHPLVQAHPVTGRPLLFLSERFAEHVVELAPSESRELLAFLHGLVHDLNGQVRWHWRPGDIAMWDERATNHRALSDHYPQERRMRRTTVTELAPLAVVRDD